MVLPVAKARCGVPDGGGDIGMGPRCQQLTIDRCLILCGTWEFRGQLQARLCWKCVLRSAGESSFKCALTATAGALQELCSRPGVFHRLSICFIEITLCKQLTPKV